MKDANDRNYKGLYGVFVEEKFKLRVYTYSGKYGRKYFILNAEIEDGQK